MRIIPWSRQPQGAPALSGPARASGAFVWHPPASLAKDFAGQPSITGLGGFSGLTMRHGDIGKMVRGGSNAREVWLGAGYAPSTSYTLLALLIDDTGRTTLRNPFDADDPDGGGNRVFQLRLTTGSFVEFIAFNTSGSAFTSTGSIATSATLPTVMVGRVMANSAGTGFEVSGWMNGRKSAPATLTGTTRGLDATDARIAVGASARASIYQSSFGGQIYCCVYLPWALSDAVLTALSTPADFYAWLFVGQIQSQFAPTSAASGFLSRYYYDMIGQSRIGS